MNTSKINLRWAIACEHAIADQRTNNLSLINFLEEIKIRVEKGYDKKSKINISTSLNIVALWERLTCDKEENYSFKLAFFSPNNKLLFEKDIEIKFKKDILRMRSIFLINKLSIYPVSGRYVFKIQRKKESNKLATISEIPLMININELN
jgi:hypothetical protein